ncbi:MAG: efflux RND transporter periplasmic adaptor subunit [Armatimonadota bacterium]
MSRRLKIGCVVSLLVAAGGSALTVVLLRRRAVRVEVQSIGRADIKEIVVPTAAGTIEADVEVLVVPRVSGVLERLLVEEGDFVEAGQIVAYLDRSEFDTIVREREAAVAQARARAETAAAQVAWSRATSGQGGSHGQKATRYDAAVHDVRREQVRKAEQAVAAARAELEDARAALRKLEAGSRPEEIARAEARLRQAEAARDAARADLDLLRQGARPEQVAQAQAAVRAAEATLRLRKREMERMRALAKKGWVAAQQVEEAETNYALAESDVREARENLDLTRAPYREEEIMAAEARLAEAEAQVSAAREDLALARDSTRSEDLEAARARVTAAEARVAQAEADLRLAAEVKTPEELAEAEAAAAALRQAEAALESARQQAGYTVIRAPITGLVARVTKKEGEVVQGGAISLATSELAMLTIVDTEQLWVEAMIDEADVGRVKKGQKVEMRVDAYPKQVFTGKVHSISPTVITPAAEVRTFRVRIAIDRGQEALRPGMSAEVDIITDIRTNVLAVPTFAVKEDDKGRKYVFVVEDGRAKRRDLQTGVGNWQNTEVKSGLEQGDRIVTNIDVKGLRDGCRVKVTKETERTDEPGGSEAK